MRTLLVARVGGVVEEVGVAVAAAAAVGEVRRLLAGAAAVVAAVLHQARWHGNRKCGRFRGGRIRVR